MKKLIPFLPLPLATLALFCFASMSEGSFYTIEDQYACIADRLAIELRMNPAYAWGGSSMEIGAPGDCSGKLRAIFASCGFMVQRVTSAQMYDGLGGWSQFKFHKEFAKGKRFTLVFFTLPPKPGKPLRINGHVGMLNQDVYEGEITKMAHAGGQGFVEVVLDKQSYYFKYITGFRGGVE